MKDKGHLQRYIQKCF